MSISLSSHELPIVLKAKAVSRRAFYLTSQGKPLFAWLHQTTRSQHGVLICAPVGHEQVHTHRSLRHLADRLAEAGFLALRFDYHDSGDSADLDIGENAYAAWLGNIRDVLAWMRETLGCQTISVMGLRLGATLATQIAAEQPIHSLILWEPIVRGRNYARELKMLSMADGAAPSSGADLEAAGFTFGKALVDEMSRVDLLKVTPKCAHALILSRDDIPADAQLLQHWQALGIAAEQTALPGYADMLAEPHFVKVPELAIEQTVSWLRRQGDKEKRRHGDEPAISPCLHVRLSPCLSERIITINSKLVSILTEPSEKRDLPLIVISNAGSAYRIGPGRLHVFLARRLAAAGFRCLRIDIGGLGDSAGDDPERENDPYTATAFRDIDRTLKFAQAELGANRAIVMGLCSGAYVAFQSAAQIANPILVESVLINPLTFFWKDGMTTDDSPVREHAAFQYYKSSALNPRKWLKLLRGETTIGFFGALRLLMNRCLPSRQAIHAETGPMPNELGHPAVDDTNGDLDRVQRHGRQLTCFFAQADPGYSLLMSLAGRRVKQLCREGKMSVHFIANADHTFSRHGPRQALLDAVEAHLVKHYKN